MYCSSVQCYNHVGTISRRRVFYYASIFLFPWLLLLWLNHRYSIHVLDHIDFALYMVLYGDLHVLALSLTKVVVIMAMNILFWPPPPLPIHTHTSPPPLELWYSRYVAWGPFTLANYCHKPLVATFNIYQELLVNNDAPHNEDCPGGNVRFLAILIKTLMKYHGLKNCGV